MRCDFVRCLIQSNLDWVRSFAGSKTSSPIEILIRPTISEKPIAFVELKSVAMSKKNDLAFGAR